MGHANFSIKGKTLSEVLEKLLEWRERNPTWVIDGATLVIIDNDEKMVIGDGGIEFEVEKIYGKIEEGYNLILRVTP